MGLKKRNKYNAEFNMSSLTDIIFLLLIFFMLTSNMTSPNTRELDRPISDSQVQSPQNVHIAIDEKGNYSVGMDPVAERDLDKILGERINEERKKNTLNGITTEVTLVLNVTSKERTGTITKFMKRANTFGVRLILATDPTQ